MMEHWFWLLLTAACLAWYSTITVYVAVRGAMDIRQMLERLGRIGADEQPTAAEKGKRE
jgi:hypothetical protein